MRLPDIGPVVVDDEKVRDYLLSFEHPVGRAKAAFFSRLGFARSEWPELRRAILALANECDAIAVPSAAFGQKYVVRGMIEGPAAAADIVTVWIVLKGDDRARLVTAYPGEVR